MSSDMFKKMKERITDEVSSATSKLQNMQLIDQLASSLDSQLRPQSNHLLPEPGDPSFGRPARPSTTTPATVGPNRLHEAPPTTYNSRPQFSLIDSGPGVSAAPAASLSHDDNELNSDTSPQHPLFDEHTIKRIAPNGDAMATTPTASDLNKQSSVLFNDSLDNSVIHLGELSSDIEDDDEDDEIDHLADKQPSGAQHDTSSDSTTTLMSAKRLAHLRHKYKSLVHELRNLNSRLQQQSQAYETQQQDLINQITALRSELETLRQSPKPYDSIQSTASSSSTSGSNAGASETILETAGRAASSDSPQLVSKAGAKVRDLERLLAKCKESLKAKNAQIQSLKVQLTEIDKLTDLNDKLRLEIKELQDKQESWQVSIAENKRIMHQEIDVKNAQIDKVKSEAMGLQKKLVDSESKIKQLKIAIQDIESRLVSTSAAHQKERESLTRDMNSIKNNALNKLQREHEHNIERVKLDLEKTIETLKAQVLAKDEQIMASVKQRQELAETNKTLADKARDIEAKLIVKTQSLEDLQTKYDKACEQKSQGQAKMEEISAAAAKREEELAKSASELTLELETTRGQLVECETYCEDLKSQLNVATTTMAQMSTQDRTCKRCEELTEELKIAMDRSQQELYDANTRLGFMTTANDDQEKALTIQKAERDSLEMVAKGLRNELDEANKKNESLALLLAENEAEIQAQQSQIEQIHSIKLELDSASKRNSILTELVKQLKTELNDKTADGSQLIDRAHKLEGDIESLKKQLHNTQKELEAIKDERDKLAKTNETLATERSHFDGRLVVSILQTIKNLETPNTSPGSDKSLSGTTLPANQLMGKSCPTATECGGDDDDDVTDCEAPSIDPISLMDKLATAAHERSTAYLLASQKLGAVLLDNSRLVEEIEHLRETLTSLNDEKTLEAQVSIEESERLRTENQALVHDSQWYEDRVKTLETELAMASDKIRDGETELVAKQQRLVSAHDKLQMDNDNLQKQLCDIKQSLSDRDKSFQELTAEVENSRLASQSHLEKIDQLHHKLAQLESDNQIKDSKRDEYQRSLNELNVQVGRLESDSKTKEAELETSRAVYQKELNELNCKLSQVQSDSEAKGVELVESHKLLATREKEFSNLQTKIEQLKSDCDTRDVRLEKSGEEYQQSLKQLNDRISQLQSDCEAKEAELDDNRSLLETYQHKLEDLDGKVSQLESDCLAKDGELCDMSTQLANSKQQSSKLLQEAEQHAAEAFATGGQATVDQEAMQSRIDKLEQELTSCRQSDGVGDYTYQMRALQRVVQQYQEENQRLRDKVHSQQVVSETATTPVTSQKVDTDETVLHSTEFEYLKNVVYQFMLGREPLVLARVISAVFKFDKSQVDHICKIQETVQAVLKQGHA